MRQSERCLIQIVEAEGRECHAGAKAPRDASRIASRLGFEKVLVRRTTLRGWLLGSLSRVWWLVKSRWYELKIPRHSVVFAQYPGGLFRGRLGAGFVKGVKQRRMASIVVLIHDVDALRGRPEVALDHVCAVSDVLIVHNDRMKDWFIARGVPVERLVVLGVFDYLSDGDVARTVNEKHVRSVMIAGNLDVEKTRYLSLLGNVKDVQWRMFGPNFDSRSTGCENVVHVGCFAPEEVLSHLDGGFGLVWDGDSVESCSGSFGTYLQYNNPHKLSLYLAGGVPVVIWGKAALAELVRREDVGLTVGSLNELGVALRGVTPECYAKMAKNAKRLGEQLRSGAFLSHALHESLSRIQNQR